MSRRSAVPSLVAAVSAVRGWLPGGRRLPADEFERRHRLLTWLLVAHLPVIVAVAVGDGRGVVDGVLPALIPAALAAGGWWRGWRLRRELCTVVGLFVCSALLVSATGGLLVMHFHFFVVVAFVAMYEDWRPLAAGLVLVVAEHAVAGTFWPHTVYAPGSGNGMDATRWAFVHGGFLLAAAAAQVLTWRYAGEAWRREEQTRTRLLDGERAVLRRMREATRMQEDLVASVSHEFRTPVTAIRGSAKTLLQHGARIRPEDREQLLSGVLAHSERLAALVENLLVASRMRAADHSVVTEVAGAVDQAVGQLHRMAPGTPVRVETESLLLARIEPAALGQVLGNLFDNAAKHGDRGTDVVVRAHGRDGQVVIEVSNAADGFPTAQADRLFDPFVQLDSSSTRTSGGVGLGLYVVRRLVEEYGGRVLASTGGGRVTVTVRLPQATAVPAYRAPAQPHTARVLDEAGEVPSAG